MVAAYAAVANTPTIRATTDNNTRMRFISIAPFFRGAEGRPTIPPRADQRGQLSNEASLEQRGASAHHSIAVFLTTFFANFGELREGEVRLRALSVAYV